MPANGPLARSIPLVCGIVVVVLLAVSAVGATPTVARSPGAVVTVRTNVSGPTNVADPAGLAVGSVSTGYLPDSIAYDGATGDVFVENEGSSNVSVISPFTEQVVGSISLPSMEGYPLTPYAVSIVWDPGNGDLYLTDGLTPDVTVISGTTDTIVTAIPIGGMPDDLALSTNFTELFVANGGSGSVAIIDTATNSVSATVSDLGWTSAIAFDSATDEAYALANFSTPIISSQGRLVGSLPPSGVLGSRMSYDASDGDLLLMDGFSKLEAIDPSNGNVNATLPLCEYPEGLTLAPGGGFAYVVCPSPAGYAASYGVLDVISVTTLAITETLNSGLSAGYSAVAVSPSDTSIYVVNSGSGTVTYFTPSSSTSIVVQFDSVGLPGGVGWGVALDGWTWQDSGTGSLSFTLADNASAYLVRSSDADWSPEVPSGHFETNQSELSLTVDFAPELYAVTFQETGVSIGAWSVSLGGASEISYFGNSLTFYEFNGSYGYSISGPSGLAATPAGGVVNVSGAPVSQSVIFTPAGPTSSTAPSGTAWPWIALGLGVAIAILLTVVYAIRRRRRSRLASPTSSTPYGRTRQ